MSKQSPCGAGLGLPSDPRAVPDDGRSRPALLQIPGLVLALAAAGTVLGAGQDSASAPRVRRPVALAFGRDPSRLFVANLRSGSLSVVDPAGARVVGEYDVGRGLADVAAIRGGPHLLAVDQAGDELLLLDSRGDAIRVVARRRVGADPVSVAVAADGSACVVASRWSRRLTFFAIGSAANGADPTLTDRGTLGLPFSPHRMTLLDDRARLLVAGAFGGELAVVDVPRRVVRSVRTLRAHNIRGMALGLDRKTLVLAHQVLNAPARTVQDDVQWGALLNNHVRAVGLDRLDPDSRPGTIDDARQGTPGELGRSSGDPGAIACGPGGDLVVVLSGVDQIAIGSDANDLQRRVAVGRRPTAIAIGPDGRTAFVADTLDDAISVVDIRAFRRVAQVSLGAAPEPSLAERGERLFFDARLSRGGWMSCHSCHTDGHSNGLNVDTFGDGQFGAAKRVPTLLGTADTAPWGWKGVFAELEDQVHQSTLTTMHGPLPTDEEVAALANYVRSLPPPREADRAARDELAVNRGAALFAARCATCHAPPSYTSARRYDVGLADEAGEREFNPPSLLGVGIRTPLLHDGRAQTLEDVLGKVRHPLGRTRSPRQVADLIAFLRTL